ncbi:hypothetical protein ZIOFF_061343 [Zingiber officinale]|uniref:Uncharacterized protein n=1 Tax=Zingiber officinale TaxID=94328 RepID=A0A8J5K9P3_ZINOF|nr:hypothetical protein ZIOFF_061343 [Zingiber officinale]
MVVGLINANPVVYQKKERRPRGLAAVTDEYAEEPIDLLEIFDHVRDIKDPEHPYSLEELKVVTEESIEVNDKESHVRQGHFYTHDRALQYGHYYWTLLASKAYAQSSFSLQGGHPGGSWNACNRSRGYNTILFLLLAHLNKQLNDKERVAAALENPNLQEMVDSCLEPTFA